MFMYVCMHRSWSPFKSLWVDTDVNTPRPGEFDDRTTPMHQRSTKSSKTKRMSYISPQALNVNLYIRTYLCIHMFTFIQTYM